MDSTQLFKLDTLFFFGVAPFTIASTLLILIALFGVIRMIIDYIRLRKKNYANNIRSVGSYSIFNYKLIDILGTSCLIWFLTIFIMKYSQVHYGNLINKCTDRLVRGGVVIIIELIIILMIIGRTVLLITVFRETDYHECDDTYFKKILTSFMIFFVSHSLLYFSSSPLLSCLISANFEYPSPTYYIRSLIDIVGTIICSIFAIIILTIFNKSIYVDKNYELINDTEDIDNYYNDL